MKRNTAKKQLTLYVFAALVMLTALAWAVAGHYKTFHFPGSQTGHPRLKPVAVTAKDSALLRRLSRVLSGMDLQNQPCTYSALVSFTNYADTARTLLNVPLVLAKDGNNCYFKYGPTEELNKDGLSLYIEHQQKKIMLGKQKAIRTNPVASMSAMKENLLTEHYQLSSKSEGPNTTIRLVNDRNVSCRLYAITYDTLTYQVKRIVARLTNYRYITDKSKDRLIDMRFLSWKKEANLGEFLQVSDVLQQQGNKWSPAGKFKTYELILSPNYP
jgi:hypothetical protein